VKIEIHSNLNSCKRDLSPLKNNNPFQDPQFFKLCENSKIVGPGTGWTPVYFLAIEENEVKGFLPCYIKNDSYGEFIFDWAWADLYQRHGIPYYPKLICALPFTPVNVSKIIANNVETEKALLAAYDSLLTGNKALSSSHFLFATKEQDSLLNELGHFSRKTIQYHFDVIYKDFNDFLQNLKARKRKQVKKERQAIKDSDIEIKVLESLTPTQVSEVYALYLTTIDKKYSQAYLNERFFELMESEYSKNTVVIAAFKEERMIAMSYFIKSETTLYGRYWGVYPEEEIQYLHFELSYYQGIEYCMRHGLKLFEAGAQGEQKLLRGFRPVEILSSHKLSIEPIHEAIEKHVTQENKIMQEQMGHLANHLPYKK
tara:strand:- start:87758 stop:88870 length:1113 start_codon:yes stop_codon:yes gene_type:complete